MIFVSRTRLPSLKKYNSYLKRIWKSNWLTNNGELVQELEKKLQEYLGVKNVVCVNNGTSALMLALKSIGIKEINLSPNSFIATASAPAWMGIKLNFFDEGEKIPAPALMTHTYGLPQMTDVSPVIYDASHAFAVKVDGKSILSYGDASIISFHAVKIFQTVEGGAVITNDDKLADKIRWMRNHGFKTHYSFQGTGINCKMSEFHAAMGLCSLETIDETKKRYDEIIEKYNKALGYNHKDVTYYPIWYSSEEKVLNAIKIFESKGIFPRRYFYPPLNKVFKGKSCPLIEDYMGRVLCLPLYYALKDREIDRIIKIVKETE